MYIYIYMYIYRVLFGCQHALYLAVELIIDTFWLPSKDPLLGVILLEIPRVQGMWPLLCPVVDVHGCAPLVMFVVLQSHQLVQYITYKPTESIDTISNTNHIYNPIH